MPIFLMGNFRFWQVFEKCDDRLKILKMTGSKPAKLKSVWHLHFIFQFSSNLWFVAAGWNKAAQNYIQKKQLKFDPGMNFTKFLYFPHILSVYNLCLFSIYMHINRMLIKAQESSPKAFKIGKPQSFLRQAPGPHPWWLARCSLLDLGLFSTPTFIDRHFFKNDGQLQNHS